MFSFLHEKKNITKQTNHKQEYNALYTHWIKCVACCPKLKQKGISCFIYSDSDKQ